MELLKQMTDALKSYEKEKMSLVVEAAIEKMMEGIIEDTFSTYGDIAKKVKEQLSKELNVNLEKFSLTEYNTLIAEHINKQLLSDINLAPLDNMIKNTIGFLNMKSIKISEIVDWLKDDEQETQGEVSFHYEINENYKWTTFYLDPDEDKPKEECIIEFTTSHHNKKIFSFKIRNYWLDKRSTVTPAILASVNHLEQKIFRLYANQVKIVEDIEDVSTSWDDY